MSDKNCHLSYIHIKIAITVYLYGLEYKAARQSIQTITTPPQPKKLLDQVRDKVRFKHFSLSTEKTYLSWIKQFISTTANAIEQTSALPK
jgi:hypothetical protein